MAKDFAKKFYKSKAWQNCRREVLAREGGTVANKGKLDRKSQTVLNYKQNGGNMKKAMIDAGYSETYADRNSRYLMGIIGKEIKDAQKEIKSEGIKSVEEIQKWWSGNIENEKLDIKDRIKSSELLVKSQGGFVEKIEAEVTKEVVINIDLVDDDEC